MDIYQFMNVSPWLSFFIVALILMTIGSVINRMIRSRDIHAKGWTPQHCDADGDFKDDD